VTKTKTKTVADKYALHFMGLIFRKRTVYVTATPEAAKKCLAKGGKRGERD
jgi:hypothetical protein